MKKLLLVVTGVLSSVCLITGCGANNNPAKSAAEDVKHAGEKMMDGTRKAIDNVTDMGTAQTSHMTQSVNKGKTDKSNFIGEESAKSIALDKAGVSAKDVSFDKVELDCDNGVWQYEVEFRKGRTEYDYDIKADDGSVLSYDVDYDD